jgi:hypothetical protein
MYTKDSTSLLSDCPKVTINADPWSDILPTMPNTTEGREITKRTNAKEAEIIQQSAELAAKTKRLSAIAGTKNLARRDQERNGPPRTRKNTP